MAEAILFDCDGVLVDSEPVAARAWRETLTAVEDFDHRFWVGKTDREVASFYADRMGTDALSLERRADAALRAILVDGLPAFPDGVAALAHAVDQGRPVAVASNSRRWRLDAVLAAAGIAVEVTVSSDDVATPKPAPDVYLAAAGLLGVDPVDCLVFEDSPSGVQAAEAAGMQVIGVSRGGSAVPGARHVTDDVLAALIAHG